MMLVVSTSRATLAAAVAIASERLATAQDRQTLRERSFQDVLVEAIRSSVKSVETQLAVRPNLSIKLSQWPAVGPVDVALVKEDGTPVAFLELKWGAGSLYNCVWDLTKMASAVAHNLAPSAFLIAGAPTGDWEDALGSELFRSDEWLTAELRTRYREHWEFWRRDVKTHPLELPEVIRTSAVAETMPWNGWSIRCVEVFAPTADWIPVDSSFPEVLTPPNPLDRFIWKEGDIEFLSEEQVEEALGFRPTPSEGSSTADDAP